MYVVTGATGNTGKVVAQALLSAGKKVRLLARTADRLQALAAKGAEVLVTDLTHTPTTVNAFEGAQAAYVMLPPNIGSPDVRSYQKQVSDALARALEKAGVPYAVTLSSIGADKPDRTGPVVGLYELEQKLNAIDHLKVLHLRAGYFMENTLGQAGVIRATGSAVGPLRPDLNISMIATRDIGQAAAKALLSLDFGVNETRELQGERDITMNEAARIIGTAIGKPGLGYLQAPPGSVRAALVGLGMSENMADLILEMSEALNSGYMRSLEKRSTKNTTPTAYETFVAEEFLPRFAAASAAA